jgi:hypothetical protein
LLQVTGSRSVAAGRCWTIRLLPFAAAEPVAGQVGRGSVVRPLTLQCQEQAGRSMTVVDAGQQLSLSHIGSGEPGPAAALCCCSSMGSGCGVVRGAAHIEFAWHSRCSRRVGRQDAGVTWRAIRVPVVPPRVRLVSPWDVGGCGVRGAVNVARWGGPPAGCWVTGRGAGRSSGAGLGRQCRRPEVRQTSARPGPR